MLQNRNKFIFFSSNHYISCLNFIWRAIAMIDYIKIKLKKRFFVNLGVIKVFRLKPYWIE